MFEIPNNAILLVEDNAMDVDLIQHALNKVGAGQSLSVARDGNAALAHLAMWEAGSPVPMVVLLDLKLPKLSGLDVLSEFKQHRVFHKVPVVVLTSSTDPGDILEAYRLEANSYILKDTDYDLFARAVQLAQRYWCRLNVNPG